MTAAISARSYPKGTELVIRATCTGLEPANQLSDIKFGLGRMAGATPPADTTSFEWAGPLNFAVDAFDLFSTRWPSGPSPYLVMQWGHTGAGGPYPQASPKTTWLYCVDQAAPTVILAKVKVAG